MDQKEFQKVVKTALDSGKLKLGHESTMTLLRDGKVKLVAVADNSPNKDEIHKYAAARKIAVFDYPGDSRELGKLCKKPFSVAALAVSE